MRSLFSLLVPALLLLNIYGCASDHETAAEAEVVTFYDVPLICGADSTIGCGSRAKPALLEMEKNPAIKEAWLNHKGTVYAIVWKDKEQTEQVAKPIFDNYGIEFSKEDKTVAAGQLKDFRADGKWHKGADVDKLSIIEASTIANTYTGFAQERKLISQEEANRIRPALEGYFKTELVKYRTPEQLFEDSDNKFKNDAVSIFSSVVGKERADDMLAKYLAYKETQCEKHDSCCTKDSTNAASACCDKK
ncbi:MAG: hypothetical protein JST27_05670 [Bacteroidetes bacterium]|nr:hypothetical protein [Bacteroidota bacterium]